MIFEILRNLDDYLIGILVIENNIARVEVLQFSLVTDFLRGKGETGDSLVVYVGVVQLAIKLIV